MPDNMRVLIYTMRIQEILTSSNVYGLSSESKKCFGKNRGIDWNKKINFGKIFILTASILPINERGRLPHLWISDVIFEIRGVKLADIRFEFERVTFIPRYWNPARLNWKGKSDCWRQHDAVLTGKRSLFSRFNLYPEKQLKFSRILKTAGTEIPGSVIYTNKSSAYKDHLYSIPLRTIPLNKGEDLNIIDKGLIATAKSRGDKGQPWREPRPTPK